MRLRPAAVILAALLASCGGSGEQKPAENHGPIALHPQNPHYFTFRGRPTILITSGEHYGAVLNLDFDYGVYLKTLRADGLNHTRVWAGTYREIPGSFNITDNTLAPHPERYVCPWARSSTPGYAQGGNKFDLAQWDEAYFARLKDFMTQASKLGIVIEMNLWCPNYDEALWKASPMQASNNVNNVGSCGKDEAYTLKHKDLLDVQEATTRKIVQELRDFDNLYYEICNEPYFAGVALDWQHRIAEVIADEEKDFPGKHLISQNIANGRAKVDKPHPAVSILNFHYCVPPDVVAMNYRLDKVIGENETGFRGKEDVLYRSEGWDFILAGGGLYNNLDYSFTTKNAAGTFLDYKSPGGGSPALRKQLRTLRAFMNGFDFVRMMPDDAVIRSLSMEGLRGRALVESGRQYAVYFHVPPGGGSFSARWSGSVDPQFSETYTFTTTAEGGARLWVDDKKLIDTWGDASLRDENATIALQAGRKAKIVMETRGGRAAKLSWASASQKKQIIPKARLFLPDGTTNGLQADYFDGRDLRTKRLTRTDAKVEFDWANRGPFPLDTREHSFELLIDLAAGSYTADWVNPKTGAVDKSLNFSHAGGGRSIGSPLFSEDVALRIKRQGAVASLRRGHQEGERQLVGPAPEGPEDRLQIGAHGQRDRVELRADLLEHRAQPAERPRELAGLAADLELAQLVDRAARLLALHEDEADEVPGRRRVLAFEKAAAAGHVAEVVDELGLELRGLRDPGHGPDHRVGGRPGRRVLPTGVEQRAAVGIDEPRQDLELQGRLGRGARRVRHPLRDGLARLRRAHEEDQGEILLHAVEDPRGRFAEELAELAGERIELLLDLRQLVGDRGVELRGHPLPDPAGQPLALLLEVLAAGLDQREHFPEFRARPAGAEGLAALFDEAEVVDDLGIDLGRGLRHGRAVPFQARESGY
ncbi:MAG: hypothetical protein HY293_02970 [Planctomycetes bacterium]|nr:hypothetical protein [Planctomycetota bacterium]